MIKALVSIDVDLAASRTIRFACQLGFFTPVELHPVYIKEAPSRELSIGSGWARHHWEKELIKEGTAEISEWMASEIDYSPEVKVVAPRVVCGDRDAELLRFLEAEPFDLYVEGARFPWNQASLYQQIHSRLFQKAPAIALAPVLRKMHSLLALCLDAPGTRALGEALPQVWSGSSLPVTLALKEGQEAALQPEAKRVRHALEEAACRLEPEEICPFFPAPPTDEYLRKYGLVALALNRGISKDSPYLEWLSRFKAPLLLALY
ncbi:MAG: hypothetical protein ACOZF2_11585 [Thermodesulfobacteriota bacterium]